MLFMFYSLLCGWIFMLLCFIVFYVEWRCIIQLSGAPHILPCNIRTILSLKKKNVGPYTLSETCLKLFDTYKDFNKIGLLRSFYCFDKQFRRNNNFFLLFQRTFFKHQFEQNMKGRKTYSGLRNGFIQPPSAERNKINLNKCTKNIQKNT